MVFSRAIWRCLETFWRQLLPASSAQRPGRLLNIRQHRAALPTKTYLDQNANSAKIEKPVVLSVFIKKRNIMVWLNTVGILFSDESFGVWNVCISYDLSVGLSVGSLTLNICLLPRRVGARQKVLQHLSNTIN